MILFKQSEALSHFLQQHKKVQKKIGFVPTMGALHNGHLSLIESAKKENEIVVCSIFVNPTQFNNAQDFQLYPVTIETDIDKLLAAACDVLFIPSTAEIYPPAYQAKQYDLSSLETVLEGAFRPGHFQGVCQVMDRLLHIVQPHNLYLGAKDYQQCMVVARLLKLLKMDNETVLNMRPTQREADGLAMSSRNLRLTPAQRAKAPLIYETLANIGRRIKKVSISELEKEGITALTTHGFEVDYLSITDADTLLPAKANTPKKIVLAAAFLDSIRLIDNLVLD